MTIIHIYEHIYKTDTKFHVHGTVGYISCIYIYLTYVQNLRIHYKVRIVVRTSLIYHM